MHYDDKPVNASDITNEGGTPRTSVIRLRTAGDLVASIPAPLFGFHPRDSVVVLLMDEKSRLACGMRVDLDDALDALDRLVDAARTARACTAVIAVFARYSPGTSDGPTGLPCTDEVTTILTVLQRIGLTVHDALHVDEGRYWSYLCHEHWCCPSQGLLVPDGTTELEARRVLAGGRLVVADRCAVQELYRPHPEMAPAPAVFDDQRHVLDGSLAQRSQQALRDVSALSAAWNRQDETAHRDTGNEVRARLGLLLLDVLVRDYVLGTLAAQDPDLTDVTRALVWLALTSTEESRPALAAIAAVMVALGGDDPAAVWALIDLAEENTLAALLAAGLQVFSPQALRDTFAAALPVVQARIDQC